MTRYERSVHDVSIGPAAGVANRRALKSLSGIARDLSESADTRSGRSAAALRFGTAVHDVQRLDPVHSD
ncbi:hypothetical protein [Burkholderia anthina]|uniref:hypothetical protein n=1 Tax=Burkholderia anthina TaxID=179879 RepID=UPI00158C8299|nr:hypothetical protein [Burkholderia anthina]